MIKTILKDKEKITIEFPLLFQNKRDSALIVLFESKRKGVVVNSSTDWKCGQFEDDWINCLDEKEWQLYDGVVMLKNSNKNDKV